MRAVAEAVLERLEDEIALDVRDRAADQRARHLLGGERRMHHRGRRLRSVEPVALGRQDRIGSDLVAFRHQHGAVDGVFQLAHVARPAIDGEHRARVPRQRPHRHAVGLRHICARSDWRVRGRPPAAGAAAGSSGSRH